MSLRTSLRERLSGMLLGSARSSSWALLGQLGVAVAGLFNFVLLARLVGPATYGQIAGALGLVLTVGPIAALGAEKLVQRDIARDREVAARAASYSYATIAGGALLTAVALGLLQPVLLPQVPVALLVTLAVAEVLGTGVMSTTAGVCFALGRGRAGGLVMLLTSTAKIAAVIVFALTDGVDPVTWSSWYLAFNLLAAVVDVAYVRLRVGRLSLAGFRPMARAREGLPYSANVTSTIAQNDADKTLLVRFGFDEQAGLYAVAYRVATIAWLPVQAVLQATLPRFFAMGEEGGLSATSRFARQLAKPLLVYGVVAAVGLVVVAPLIPLIVGDEYQDSVTLLMWLAPLSLFKVAQYVPSDALTGAGHQPIRTACIAISMTVNIGLGIVFIPQYGVAAAIVATFVAELLYAALVTLAVRRGVRREEAST